MCSFCYTWFSEKDFRLVYISPFIAMIRAVKTAINSIAKIKNRRPTTKKTETLITDKPHNQDCQLNMPMVLELLEQNHLPLLLQVFSLLQPQVR